MTFWDKRPRGVIRPIARRDDVVARRAQEVVTLVTLQHGQGHVLTMVRICAAEAPELLALGPVPATFAARILHGLCSAEERVRASFIEMVQREAQPPASPTITGMLKAGLLARQPRGVDVTERGRRLLELLVETGAIPDASQGAQA